MAMAAVAHRSKIARHRFFIEISSKQNPQAGLQQLDASRKPGVSDGLGGLSPL
jgi:hypothetical protein